MPSPFAPRTDGDVLDLVRNHPLAWLVGTRPDGTVLSSQLPLLPIEENGVLTGLLGHVPRRNPLVEHLRASPRAAVLVQGPNAYVSPSWYDDRDSAPSWIYANATFTVDVAVREDLTDRSLDLLVDRMEDGRPDRWRLDEIAHRYTRLRDQVVAFVATVVTTDARFKLAQDEGPEVVIATLTKLTDPALVALVGAFNGDRIGRQAVGNVGA